MSRTKIGEPTPEFKLNMNPDRNWFSIDTVPFFPIHISKTGKEIIRVSHYYNELNRDEKITILKELKNWIDNELINK